MRRSYLTPGVFRRLLSPEGFAFRCPNQIALACRTRPRSTPSSFLCASTRRSLWGFSAKPERKLRGAQFDPGLGKMMELSSMESMRTRPPPIEELVSAWKKFFQFKHQNHLVVNNLQARHVVATLQHLRKSNPTDSHFGLDLADIELARRVLLNLPSDGIDAHVELATELHAESMRRFSGKDEKDRIKFQRESLSKLITVLTRTGQSARAMDLLKQHLAEDDQVAALVLYRPLVTGFAREGKETEMLATYHMAKEAGLQFTSGMRNVIISFFANKNDVEATKYWYSQRDEARTFAAVLLSDLLNFSIRNNELEWCRSVFRDAVNSNPKKSVWNIILQWAAGVEGKGVEEVEQLMKIMRARHSEDKWTAPDSSTINGLIEMAMEKNDAYTAERYADLGRKFGINPDAKTFIQQIKYRATKGDLTGAQSAYERLQAEEVSNDEDLPAINVYIRALCSGRNGNYDRIRAVMSDLEERNIRLEAATTGALAIMYLERDELHDALDVLQANSYHYSVDERESIRELFVKFCLDSKNDTARVWDAYTIMREVFNETNREVRTTIMNEFFRRERCDMACYTFGHMRQNIDTRIRPVAETYIQCLEGIAHLADVEQLEMVHNMLKMDASIEPSTKLYNALMLAYAECDDADRAVEFWEDITNSDEGPTYNSLIILFRACELKPFAEKLAMDTWDKMRRMDIEITKDVLLSYMAALAGRGQMDEAKKLVEGMSKKHRFPVDATTLGLFYNSAMGDDRRDQVEEWAKRLYPEVWTEVTHLGRYQHEEGYLLFKIPRRQLRA